jgi:hypothetical protein
LQASGGAIAGDYFFSQKLHQRYSATYRYITIPGGTTFEENPDFNLESGFFVISPFETRKTHS